MKRLTNSLIVSIFCLGLIPLWAIKTSTTDQKVVIQTNPADTSVTTIVHQSTTADSKGNVKSFTLTEYKPNDPIKGNSAIAELETNIKGSGDVKGYLGTFATISRIIEGTVNNDGTVTIVVKDANGNIITSATTYPSFKDAQDALNLPFPPAVLPTGVGGGSLIGGGTVGTPQNIVIVPESP